MSTVWPAAVGWEFGMQSLLLHGDLFMRLVRASRTSPNIIGIVPVHPLLVDVRKIDGRMVYVVNEDGIVTAYDQDDMIHVPGPGFNGFRGMSQISYVLRQPANIARDAGDQASNVLDAGMRPDLALISKSNTPIKSDQVTLMRDQWVTRYSGKGKSAAPIVLSGMDIKELSLTAADAQLLVHRHLVARLHVVRLAQGDVELAVVAALAPFDVHGPTIVLLNHQRVGSQLFHIRIGQ